MNPACYLTDKVGQVLLLDASCKLNPASYLTDAAKYIVLDFIVWQTARQFNKILFLCEISCTFSLTTLNPTT